MTDKKTEGKSTEYPKMMYTEKPIDGYELSTSWGLSCYHATAGDKKQAEEMKKAGFKDAPVKGKVSLDDNG